MSEKFDLQELQRTSNRVLKLYRLRNDYLEKRLEIVGNILKNQDRGSTFIELDTSFLLQLGTLGRRERKLIKILKLGQNDQTSAILIGLDYFRHSLSLLNSEESKQLESELRKYGVDLDSLIDLIKATIRLLERLNSDLDLVRSRLASEDELLAFIQPRTGYLLDKESTDAFRIFLSKFASEYLANESIKKELDIFLGEYKIQIDWLELIYRVAITAPNNVIPYSVANFFVSGGASEFGLAMMIVYKILIQLMGMQKSFVKIKHGEIVRDIKSKWARRHWWNIF